MEEKTFRRVEKKYIITENQYKDIIRLCKDKLKKDRYYKSTICNIYFDTKNNDLIINSIEKPLYKEKIRLRSYGVPNMDSKVFFEIKKKYKGIVSKRREVMTLKAVYDYLNNNKIINTQIMKEIDFCFKKYDLIPAIYLAYDRYSYCDKEKLGFRLTFDYNIRSRVDDLNLELGDYGDKLLDDKVYIMEVKCLEAMPIWFCKILSKLQIYPTSFSKYGKIYEKRKLEVV